MRRTPLAALFCCLSLSWLSSLGGTSDFKIYPGATVDKEATREATEMLAQAKSAGTKVTIYTSEDPFVKVAAFYKGLAKECAMPRTSGSSGKPVKFEDDERSYDLSEAFFVFDGAANIKDSRFWVKVQRPYIGEEVRDVTAIVVTEKTR